MLTGKLLFPPRLLHYSEIDIAGFGMYNLYLDDDPALLRQRWIRADLVEVFILLLQSDPRVLYFEVFGELVDIRFELEPATLFDCLHRSVILDGSQWDRIGGIILHLGDKALLFALMDWLLFELVLDSTHFDCHLIVVEFEQSYLGL